MSPTLESWFVAALVSGVKGSPIGKGCEEIVVFTSASALSVVGYRIDCASQSNSGRAGIYFVLYF